ncbi:hypothetical protein FJU08_16290 [Martelella alba]|uniref:DUF5591 domain-containing protein n=1 Tax=Martelella alba TaxID=2590451 RepID=A0A506U3B7_9HYPH|nr:hypothetical protein [Martelella alba]TPW28883.1 hypothetical protein FJU08_16290 [Martelella alba]
MVSIENRKQRIEESKRKIQAPFHVDPELCIYSPQDNVDSLAHPRIAAWLDFVRDEYQPDLPEGKRHILLFMPCTKTKPYPFSTEHQAINQRLIAEGFRPTGNLSLPQDLVARLEDGIAPEVLNLTPLKNDAGTVIHRMVISEPMGVVPYEHIAEYKGLASPACAYDDPGLFEGRGNAVSPWRADCTAVKLSDTKWRWGDEEKRHYVLMHNAMADAVAAVVARIGGNYDDIISWVAPGLTHRSFVIAAEERSENKVVARRKIGSGYLTLEGANDQLAKSARIECLPTLDQCRDAVQRLMQRLDISESHAQAIYARGGANATPLALPELLDVLMARLGL